MKDLNIGDMVIYSLGKGEHYTEKQGIIKDIKVEDKNYCHVYTYLKDMNEVLPCLVSYKNIIKVL